MLDKTAELFSSTRQSVPGSSIGNLQSTQAADDRDNSADFDWSNDSSIILRPQPGIAAYYNKANELVIRQEAVRGYDEEDRLIFINPENQQTFIDKLTDIMGVPSLG